MERSNGLSVVAVESPFDSIRRVSGDGQEFWLARELMGLLGYRTWQKFREAIEKAKITCRLNNELEASHIGYLPGAVNPSGGRFGDDYQLSRSACYWVAMAGDVRKSQIAAAHQYFATKTREAETAAPAKLPTIKEMAYMLIAAEEAREALAAQIEADAGCTALGKVIKDSQSKNIRIGDFAKILGDIGQHKYFDELRAEGLIIPGSTLPYQRFIDAGYFRVTQVRGTGGATDKWFPVTMITPKGQAYLASRHRKLVVATATVRIIEAQVSALV